MMLRLNLRPQNINKMNLKQIQNLKRIKQNNIKCKSENYKVFQQIDKEILNYFLRPLKPINNRALKPRQNKIKKR